MGWDAKEYMSAVEQDRGVDQQWTIVGWGGVDLVRGGDGGEDGVVK